MSHSVPRHPWTIVARREMMVKLTDKPFWISTIVTIVVIILAFGASFLFGEQFSRSTIAVTDADGAAVVEIAGEINPGMSYEAQQVGADEIRDVVRDGDADLGIQRTESGWEVFMESMGTNSAVLQQAIESFMLQDNADRLGIELPELYQGSEVTFTSVTDAEEGDDTAQVAFIAGLVFSLLFMMSALTYGLQIAQSVVEEKESRIVEILVSAIPIRHLLWGKVAGNSIMALGQLVLLLAVSIIAVTQTEFAAVLPAIAPSIGWFVVFFLFGFAALACLWAAAGALATRVQDLNNATMPLTMLIMVAYVVGFSAQGTAAKILAYVPILSSIMMPRQLLEGEATWLDAIIALAIVSAFMTVAIWIGERVYRRGVMNTSGVLKWSQALKTDA